jgi:glutathione S-transferase
VLDATVGPQAAVLNRTGADRRDLLRISAFAAGAADKAISLVYESVLREAALPMWVERCRAQVGETLDLLEAERAQRSTPYLFDDALSHADVVLATVTRFISEALDGEFKWAGRPALQAHSARCEALAAFQQASQPFLKPGEG